MNQIDLRRADLNLLVVFQVLLGERHVGRAAKRLALTQSAASHALGRLRDLLQDPLFVRHPKGIEPTARALALAPAIARIPEARTHVERGVVPAAAPAVAPVAPRAPSASLLGREPPSSITRGR